MDRPLAFASACAACGVVSFATLPVRGESAAAHAAESATWALLVAAVVLGLLATDGIGDRKLAKRLVMLGVFAAAIRALFAFSTMLPSG